MYTIIRVIRGATIYMIWCKEFWGLNDFDFEVVCRRRSEQMVLVVLWMSGNDFGGENTHICKLKHLVSVLLKIIVLIEH